MKFKIAQLFLLLLSLNTFSMELSNSCSYIDLDSLSQEHQITFIDLDYCVQEYQETFLDSLAQEHQITSDAEPLQLSQLTNSFADDLSFKIPQHNFQEKQNYDLQIAGYRNALSEEGRQKFDNLSAQIKNTLQNIATNPELSFQHLLGENGLRDLLIDSQKFKTADQQAVHNFNYCLEEYINQMESIIYDQNSGQLKTNFTLLNEQTDLANIYKGFLEKFYGKEEALRQVKELASKNNSGFQKILDKGWGDRAVSWFYKKLFKKDSSQQNPEFQRKIKDNVFNKNLYEIHKLCNQGRFKDALILGEKNGILKNLPKLRSQIKSNYKSAIYKYLGSP